ncbi:hypothetical protein [Thermococcus atlanticus]
MSRKKILVVLLLVALVLYFSFRGVLIEMNPEKTGYSNSSAVSSYLPRHECPFKVQVTKGSITVTFDISGVNKTLNYTFYGQKASSLCFPNGGLLYAMYPGDPGTDTYAVFITKDLKELWKTKFKGLLSPLFYSNGTLLFLKQGNEELNVKPCLYWVDLKTGALSRKICLQEKHGATVGAVKFLGGKIYLATSTGHVYLVEGSEVRRAYFDSIWGITVGAKLKLDVSERYVAVAYSFANVEGKEKNGLCVLTSSLKKIACKSLKEEPQAVRIYGNTVYLQVGGKVKAYRILGL